MEENVPVKPVEKRGALSNQDGVQIKVSKKMLWSLGITVAVFVLGLLVWQQRWYQPAYALYANGSVELKVKEGDKFPVEGAVVTLNGATYTTDSTGKATVRKVLAGTYTLNVRKDGFTPLEQPLTLKRGDNGSIVIPLTKLPEKLYAIRGFVQDYVSEKSLVDVQITAAGTSIKTNPNGEYSFDRLAPGEYKLILSKSGYIEKEVPISLVDSDITATKVALVPSGQVIFVSNRDGKRALYTSNYDGSDQRQFIAPEKGGEDYGPILSPDGKWVIFSSTRDGVKSSFGSDLPRLYIVGRDGKELKRVNEDVSHSDVRWSSNSRYLYYQAYTNSQENQSVQRFYDVGKGTAFDFGDTLATEVVFSTGGDKVAYTLSKYGENGKPEYITYVKTLDLVTGERKDILNRPGNALGSLAFSGNDSALSYETTVDGTRRRFEVVLANIQEREITLPPRDDRRYVIAPNGSLKAFTEKRDGRRDLFSVELTNGMEKRLTTLGVVSENIPIVWDESGRYLTFAVRREGENALYIVALDGGIPKKLTDFFDGQDYPDYY